jgi:hypothetical protein
VNLFGFREAGDQTAFVNLTEILILEVNRGIAADNTS